MGLTSAAALGLGAVLLLSGCGTGRHIEPISEPTRPPVTEIPGRQPAPSSGREQDERANVTSGGWVTVALDASGVSRLESWGPFAVAGGHTTDGRPLLALLERDDVGRIDVGDAGRVWSLAADYTMSVAVDDDDPTTSPQAWCLEPPPYGTDQDPAYDYDVVPCLEDGSGRAPDRLWFTTEDEGEAVVGGFVDEDGHLGLIPLNWDVYEFMAGPPQLYLAADASAADLLVMGREEAYVVIGPVSPEPGATKIGRQVWFTDTSEHAWARLEIDLVPDVITDWRGWALDVYVAGPVGDRPVVVDVFGPAREVPDVRLDPAHPVVLIAEVPTGPGDRPSVVMQTTDGAVLYLPTGHDGWTTLRLPPGRARGALVTRDGHKVTAYALVDDHLWWHDLSELDEVNEL